MASRGSLASSVRGYWRPGRASSCFPAIIPSRVSRRPLQAGQFILAAQAPGDREGQPPRAKRRRDQNRLPPVVVAGWVADAASDRSTARPRGRCRCRSPVAVRPRGVGVVKTLVCRWFCSSASGVLVAVARDGAPVSTNLMGAGERDSVISGWEISVLHVSGGHLTRGLAWVTKPRPPEMECFTNHLTDGPAS